MKYIADTVKKDILIYYIFSFLLSGVVLLFLKPTPLTPNQPPAAGEGGNFSPIGRGES